MSEPAAQRQRWWRSPVLVLVLVAPFVGEFVLGNLPPFLLPLIVAVAPMYGGGALLIRELAVRRNLRWSGVAALALAYGLVEEGVVTESLFNPSYAGQRLLDPGFVPWLGTGLPWAVFVLGLHVMGSICAPIAIAQAWSGPAATRPWLGPRGLAVTGAVFVVGCVVNGVINQSQWPYAAPWYRLLEAVVLAALAALLGSRLRRRDRPDATAGNTGRAPSPLVVALVVGLLAGAFLASVHLIDALRPAGTVVLQLAVAVVGSALLTWWSRRPGWTPRHVLAAAAGVTVAYAVRALAESHPTSGAGIALVVGSLVVDAIALLVLRGADRRSRPVAPAPA